MATIEDKRAKLDSLTRAMRQLRTAADAVVTVGVHSDAGNHEGAGKPIGMAALAAIHEYGTERIPARKPLTRAVNATRGAVTAMLTQGIGAVIDGTASVRGVLDEIGALVENEVHSQITNGLTPALAQSTKIARLRSTQKGRGIVNRGQRAARSLIMGGKFKTGYAKFIKGAGGTNKFRGGKWVRTAGGRHSKALAKLEKALSGKFTPLYHTHQLIASYTHKVGKRGGA